MKRIGYYKLTDPSKTLIAIEKFPTLVQAVYHFADLEELEVPDFLKLYRVKQA